MQTFSIEQDYLGEFRDPISYDLESGGDYLFCHFYVALAQQTSGPVLELASGTHA